MAIRIGWCTANLHASELLFEPPEPVRINIPCPVIGSWASQTFALRAPYDMEARIQMTQQGPAVELGAKGPNAEPHEVWSVARPNTWSRADRPVVNWSIQNLFVADEEVIMETTAPFCHFQKRPWPGVMLPTRFDIRSWTRPVPWTFEWRKLDEPLIIERGEPIQYVRFHTRRNEETFRIVPLEFTEEMQKAIDAGRSLGPFKRHLPGVAQRLFEKRPRRWLP